MEPMLLLILSTSIIGIVVLIGLSQFKVEHHVTRHFNSESNNFSMFLTKIRGYSSKVRR